MTEKYYVIPRGARFAYTAMVHREGCPMLGQLKNARVRDRNPLDSDEWNHYQKCQRCWPVVESVEVD